LVYNLPVLNAEEAEVTTVLFDGNENDVVFPLFVNEAPTHHVGKSSFEEASEAPESHNTEEAEVTTVLFDDDDNGEVLYSVLVASEFEPDNDGCGGKARDDATRSLVGEVSRQHRERKATKSDDAEVPEYLWEDHFLSDGPTPWVVTDRTKLREAMWLLRRRMLLWWQRNVTITFFRWAHDRYLDLSCLDSKFEEQLFLKTIDTYGHQPQKLRVATVIENGGSNVCCSLGKTCTQLPTQLAGRHMRHGGAGTMAPGFFIGAGQSGIVGSFSMAYRFISGVKSLRSENLNVKDGVTRDRMRKKLSAVKERQYIRPGFVKSLTSYFLVPERDEDSHKVYDGTVSGLNDSIWVPRFILPTMNTHLRGVDKETEMADVDVGECFFNFMLHSEMRELAGIDLTPPISETEREWFGKHGSELPWG
jgi:hypothetical protein